MADNYLEKKMEELRLGKSKISAPKFRQVSGIGKLSFNFPQKRVVVTGATAGIRQEIARAYIKAGCHVAVFGSDRQGGDAMAHNEGIRFHCVPSGDQDALKRAFSNLLEAWRRIDVAVCLDKETDTLSGIWREHRRLFPFPDGYGARMIILSTEYGEPAATSEKAASEIARMCLFLSMPANVFPGGAEFSADGYPSLRFRYV